MVAPAVVRPIRIGRYLLLDELASGGMGTVYLGRLDGAAGFARCIAAKALHPHLAKDPEFVAMFLDEARLAARVRHPNVVSTIDVIVDSGKIVMVMEYVHGETLRKLIRAAREHERRLPPPIVASVMYGALLGLQAAHDAHNEKGEPLGLVHRDVTPHNIVVGTDGVARVLDFGIAKAMGQLHTTKEGTIKGKFAYMAPEQIRGDFVGRQADVYSAGVVLWEALTGERLFPGSNDGEILERVLFSTPDRPSSRAPGIPEALDAVVMRAIARERAHRFGSAREMAAALVKACPAAAPDQVGEMVEQLAHESLAERAERIRRIEMRQPSPASTSGPSSAKGSPQSGTGTARDGVVADSTRDAKPVQRRLSQTVAVAGAVAALAGAGFLGFKNHSLGTVATPSSPPSASSPSPRPPQMRFHGERRLTYGDGCDEFPSFSPDGKSIVFDATAGPDSHLRVLDIESGATREITSDPGWNYYSNVSPDGRQVAFLKEINGSSATFVVGIEGGASRRIAAGDTLPTWSPDGSRIWAGDFTHITSFDAATGALHETIEPPTGYLGAKIFELRDGSLLALLIRRGDAAAGSTPLASLWAVSADRSRMHWVEREGSHANVALWPDDRHVLASRINAGDRRDLLDIPLDGSEVTVLAPGGLDPWQGLEISRDGGRIAWSDCRGRSEIVRPSASGASSFSAVFGEAKWSDDGFAFIPKSSQLVVISTRGGERGLWVMDVESRAVIRSLPLPWKPSEIAALQDGLHVAVSGPQGIALVGVDGTSPPRPLTSDPLDNCLGSLRNGTGVLFSRPFAAGMRTMLVSTSGGDARQFMEGNTRCATQSPADDSVVYLAGDTEHALTPMLYDPNTGVHRALSSLLTPAVYRLVHFSPDGRHVAMSMGEQEIVEVEVATGKVSRRPLTVGVAGLDYTTRSLLFSAERWEGNLWIADVDGSP